jgi:YesN/AraC family two-component response regulator
MPGFNNGKKEFTAVCARPVFLIVDDEEMMCDLIRDELDEQGYVCDVAPNADDALTKIEIHSYDVVLLDIMLPGMSGIDLLKIIEKYHQKTAIIMITAVDDLNTAVEAMKLGASDYIVKPFTLDKINASISTVLKNRELRCTVNNAVPYLEEEDYGKNADDRSLSEINAIADGVDAQVDRFDFHSEIVNKRTVGLARWLSIPEEEIKKWAIARDKLYSERDRRIKSALSKVERNPMAQVMLGLTHSVYHSEYSEEQN